MEGSTQDVVDSGAQALVTIAQFYQVATDLSQLRHQFAKPSEPFSDMELLLAAKAIGFKARLQSSSFAELNNGILPAIAKSCDGQYFIIARVAQEQAAQEQVAAESSAEGLPPSQAKALVLLPGQNQPQELSVEQLAQQWSGELILVTRRQGLLASVREFDISWFIPSLVKYRKLFGDVLLASFFLQLFALVTPLFLIRTV